MEGQKCAENPTPAQSDDPGGKVPAFNGPMAWSASYGGQMVALQRSTAEKTYAPTKPTRQRASQEPRAPSPQRCHRWNRHTQKPLRNRFQVSDSNRKHPESQSGASSSDLQNRPAGTTESPTSGTACEAVVTIPLQH